MAFFPLEELEKKYQLTSAQKAKIREAREKNALGFTIEEEPVTRLTGLENPATVSKVSVFKYNEDEIKKLLNL